ncbi:MAG TPA: dTMP kinase [Acidimicrobiales bacterium]|nr:dTMP kinase [Acidimicrobiales bacterium]
MKGSLVVLEGGEACGKSTQAARLAQRLGAVLTREPGGTAMGERIRALVLDHAAAGLVPRAEALLMAAARAQHVAEVVAPALAAGRHVVSDRFTGSSLGYQGYGRGLSVDELRVLSHFATDGVEADVVVLLQLDPAIAAARRARRLDRLEAAGAGFHRRVAEGFAALAAADPHRWVSVDGGGDEDEVAERVWSTVSTRLLRPIEAAEG